jgi:hypothetical protein
VSVGRRFHRISKRITQRELGGVQILKVFKIQKFACVAKHGEIAHVTFSSFCCVTVLWNDFFSPKETPENEILRHGRGPRVFSSSINIIYSLYGVNCAIVCVYYLYYGSNER